MKKTTLVIAALLIFSLKSTLAFEFSDTSLGIGNLTQFVGKVQTDVDGSERKFDFSPYISLSANWKFAKNWVLIPEIGIGLPQKTVDDNVSYSNYFIMAAVGYNLMDWVFRGGLGLSFTRFSGDGGTAVVSNGTGSDAFFLPSESSVSSNVITNIGAEYFFHSDWSARLDAHLYNIFDSNSRAFSYTGSFHYHFGKWKWD